MRKVLGVMGLLITAVIIVGAIPSARVWAAGPEACRDDCLSLADVSPGTELVVSTSRSVGYYTPYWIGHPRKELLYANFRNQGDIGTITAHPTIKCWDKAPWWYSYVGWFWNKKPVVRVCFNSTCRWHYLEDFSLAE